ncbi:uncharacterized protein LOC111408663 isoform X4 [Olea europaea var. sylvestris]|uniref:uncharacterized protein LOC111408663 isoform X4 n=1 Tax=Olea europaea var. sylvestris TaxID=158386 RepID=UPI000C1D2D21|nr:uncharacterized protein LOC111408663 isoform X4 [Olea europaea var. sylvestris]
MFPLRNGRISGTQLQIVVGQIFSASIMALLLSSARACGLGCKQSTTIKGKQSITVRQKRADAKKALKNLIFNGGCSKSTAETFHHIEAECEDQYNKKSRIKPARQARRAYHKKIKRKLRRDNMFEDFDAHPERIFQATFGKRCFTWTFKPWEMGFDWRENFSWNNRRYEEHDTKGGTEFTSGSTIVGTYSDRITLGLPPAGPLKIEDVKTAFRSSALKWHPDKHQGPSQADAEEKFKHCVNAYKSLCIALSTSA